MSDEPALLAAIRAHPDEDTPRLIYADWLDENGQGERAEFIRLQCAPDADEAAEDRADELEDRNRTRWLVGLPQFVGARWEFRRGFPDHLVISADLLLERYDAFARVPWLRSLCVFDLSNATIRHFCNRPWNPRWVELELIERPDATTSSGSYSITSALANCPQVWHLRRLRLSLCDAVAVGVLASLCTHLGDRLIIG